MNDINLALVLPAAFISTACPGPSTLSVLSTSMVYGRRFGFINAFGIWTGALLWSVFAAIGLGSILSSNPLLMSTIKIVGAVYLLFLSYRSAISARVDSGTLQIDTYDIKTSFNAYSKGLFIQLSNPKAPLYFGSLYSIAIPMVATADEILQLILLLSCNSFIVLFSYAFLFSTTKARNIFTRLQKSFNICFSIIFAVLGFKLIF